MVRHIFSPDRNTLTEGPSRAELLNARMNSILREEVQTALNKRIGCGLNVSFNNEQYGSEELLRGHAA